MTQRTLADVHLELAQQRALVAEAAAHTRRLEVEAAQLEHTTAVRDAGDGQTLARWISEGLVVPLVEALAPLVAEDLREHPPIERVAYSLEECAEALGISKDLVYGLIRSGDLASVQLGGRGGRRLIRAEAVAEFLARAEADTAAAISAEQGALPLATSTANSDESGAGRRKRRTS